VKFVYFCKKSNLNHFFREFDALNVIRKAGIHGIRVIDVGEFDALVTTGASLENDSLVALRAR
jgi:hypothetical protein